jgi:hypothetical protein
MPLTGLKYQEAEARLPDELKPMLRELVKQYEYLTTLHYGRGYVAYQVLADLILAGWRQTEPSHPKSKI